MPGQVFVSVHCWNGSCSFLPASSSSFKMLPRLIHCPDDRGFHAICHSSQFLGSQQLRVELITLTDQMERHYEKLFSYLQIKIKISTNFYLKKKNNNIILLNIVSTSELAVWFCWFYDRVFTEWLSAFPLF